MMEGSKKNNPGMTSGPTMLRLFELKCYGVINIPKALALATAWVLLLMPSLL